MHLRLTYLLAVLALISGVGYWYYKNTVGKEVPVVVDVVSPDIVSPEEMDAFLQVWSEYMHDKISRQSSRQISLSTKEPSSELVKWLNKRGWDVERFFFVEQRLASVVKSAFLKKHSVDTIKVLEIQLAAEKDPQIRANIENVIKSQQQLMNVEKVSDGEINMVLPDLNNISEILEGKAVYRP